MSHKSENVHRKFHKLSEACQDLQWNHDTSTPHRSETNGVAERAVRKVTEGTSIARVQSGLLEEWWDCATECQETQQGQLYSGLPDMAEEGRKKREVRAVFEVMANVAFAHEGDPVDAR